MFLLVASARTTVGYIKFSPTGQRATSIEDPKSFQVLVEKERGSKSLLEGIWTVLVSGGPNEESVSAVRHIEVDYVLDVEADAFLESRWRGTDQTVYREYCVNPEPRRSGRVNPDEGLTSFEAWREAWGGPV